MINNAILRNSDKGRIEVLPPVVELKTFAVLAGDIIQFEHFVHEACKMERYGDYVYVDREERLDGLLFDEVYTTGTWDNAFNSSLLIHKAQKRLKSKCSPEAPSTHPAL